MSSLADPAYAVPGADLPLTNRSLLSLGQEVLARGAAFRFRAMGWSMSPFIREGDIICLSPVPAGGPRTGDVLAFTPPGSDMLVVHRVVAVSGGDYLVQGDNMPGAPDGWIARDQVLGQVSRVERKDRRVRVGLGPERRLIAALSRSGVLAPLLRAAAMLLRRSASHG